MICDKENINTFHEDDLAKYKHIGLYDFGRYAELINEPASVADGTLHHASAPEAAWVYFNLRDFLKDDCLMVSAEALQSASGSPLIGIADRVFGSMQKPDAFIAIGPMAADAPDVEAPRYCEPLEVDYRQPNAGDGSTHFPYFSAVNQVLDKLGQQVCGTPLEEILEQYR